METTTQPAGVPPDQSHGQVHPDNPAGPPSQHVLEHHAITYTAAQRVGQAVIVVIVLVLAVAFLVFILGWQLPHLAHGHSPDETTAKDERNLSGLPGVSLVKDKAHTVAVPDLARNSLGMFKGGAEMIAVAQAPTEVPPLVLPGSTALDPIHLARIRARFAPARVVKIGESHDFSHETGHSEFRELRPGDRVAKGEVLGIFYSVDVGSKKNDLLDALTQLELDQQILDNAEKHEAAVPRVFMLAAERAVQTDRNQVDRALHNLEAWDIPQDEIDALRAEAKKQAADKNAWKKTREGAWATGGEPAPADKIDPNKNKENPWGRVTLRAPFDGVIVERNVHVDEMVVDNTVNLFQIAQVKKLLVVANCPEDQLPTIEAMPSIARHWTVSTVGIDKPLPGAIDEVGYLIDPNQHTAVIKGYVENPGEHLRAGQFISATVPIAPPEGVVEIPMNALMDDGQQSLVFVQTDPGKAEYAMRRVQVTNRFGRRAFVRSTPIPKEEQLTAEEAEEGCLPKEPLRKGERVLTSGTGELHMAILDLESEALKNSRADKH
jgi:cobalt-zinc-cadmium efflux system membrane fusion protein